MTSASFEEHVTTLVHPAEYEKHGNQIVAVYSDKLILMKSSRMLSVKGPAFVEFPMAACTAIVYKKKWAILSMLLGSVFVIGIPLVFVFGSVDPGLSFPVTGIMGGLGLGYVLLRGPRRHRLTFVVNDKLYKWQSVAGDFTYKQTSVQKVIDFAKGKGLMPQDTRAAF